jgi:hypothetical protein
MTPITLRNTKEDKVIPKLKLQYQFYRQQDKDHGEFRGTNEFEIRIEDLPNFIEGIKSFIAKYFGTSNSICPCLPPSL